MHWIENYRNIMYMILHQYSYQILCNEIGSFFHLYNDDSDRHHQYYLSESSSPSPADSNYIQNQGSNADTNIEIEVKETPPPQSSPFTKMILIVDDDPDITLTFKAGLDGHYYGYGDNKKRFEVYTYNDPLLVVKEFKPHFYDLLLTDIYMSNMNGFQLCEKILELDVNIRVWSKLDCNIIVIKKIVS